MAGKSRYRLGIGLGGSATFYRGRFEFGLKSSDRFLVWHRSVGYRLAGGYLSCLLYNFFSSGLGAEGQLQVISLPGVSYVRH